MNRHSSKKMVAFGAAVALGTGLVAAAPLAATAATGTSPTGPSSYAQGKFLSGAVAGIDLDRVVAVQPAEASNDGTQSPQTDVDPLGLTVLDLASVQSDRVGVDVAPGASGGVLSQYAHAAQGSALAASGTVGAGGAIGLGANGAPGGDLTVDLDSLLGSTSYASLLSQLKLQVQAIAAQAKGDTDTLAGSYSLEGLKLTLTSPAIADLGDELSTQLGGVSTQLKALGGDDGALADSILSILKSKGLSNGLANADVDVNVDADLNGIVSSLLQRSYGSKGITVDLATGTATVDLEQVLGGNLNGKAVGYDVLNDGAVNSIVKAITASIDSVGSDLVDAVNDALRHATVDADVDLSLLTAQPDGQKQVCEQPGTGVVGSLVNGLLCHTVSVALPDLKTSASVDVHGTVQQVLDGTSPATVTAQLLGVPVTISTGALLTSLKGDLIDHLFDTNGAVETLTSNLADKVLDPADANALSIAKLLDNAISITLNLQSVSMGTGGQAVAQGASFTETAMRIGVVGSTAVVNLASATVSPNLAATPGTPTDDPSGTPTPTPTDTTSPSPAPDSTDAPGAGGDNSSNGDGTGTGTGNDGSSIGDDGSNPGDDGSSLGDDTSSGSITPTAAGSGSLAFTGMDLVGLIALILALLATGTAIVAREHYRRTHLSDTL